MLFADAVSYAEKIDKDHRGHAGYKQLRESWLSQKYSKALCGESLRGKGKVVDIIAVREEEKGSREVAEVALIEVKLCLRRGGKASSLGQISAKIYQTLEKLLKYLEVPDKLILYIVIPKGFLERVLEELWNRWKVVIRDVLAEELGEKYRRRNLTLHAELTLLGAQPPYVYKVELYDADRRTKLRLKEFPLKLNLAGRVFRVVDVYIIEVEDHDSSS